MPAAIALDHAPAAGSRLGSGLREAGLAALVAALLLIPIAGLQTVPGVGGLAIALRPAPVITGVALVFLGRLLLAFLRRAPGERRESGGIAVALSRYGRFIGAFALGVAIALPFLPFADRYVVDVATSILIYVMLGWGLNIVVGLAGLLDLGYVAFYAVGAYSYALIAIHLDLGFWFCLPLAGLFAASFGILLGFPVLRLRGDYLAIVTLGFGEIIRIVLLNWQPVTGGPNGLANIPRPTFLGMEFTRRPEEGETAFHQFFGLDYSGDHRVTYLYFIILALALVTNLFVLRIRRLPIGRAWEALREDEIACKALGINPTNVKLTAFALGAMFGGFAGAFFATRQGFISPESFTFIESAIILAIVVLGGMGSQIGVVLAAVIIVLLPEAGRFLPQLFDALQGVLPLPPAVDEWAASFGQGLGRFRMLLFGAAMVGIMIWRPRGLLSHRNPTVLLHGRPVAPGAPSGTGIGNLRGTDVP